MSTWVLHGLFASIAAGSKLHLRCAACAAASPVVALLVGLVLAVRQSAFQVHVLDYLRQQATGDGLRACDVRHEDLRRRVLGAVV